MVGGFPDVRYKEYEWQLSPGAKVFVYTDGVPEAGVSRGDAFGTERMLQVLRETEDSSPREILRAVDQAVAAFVEDAPQFDDLTMLCVQYYGQS